MIPVDTNFETGLNETERECRGLGKQGRDAMIRNTFIPNPTEATRSLLRQSRRLAAMCRFKGVKRSRRPLKLSTSRLLHAQFRVAERSRAVIGETSSPLDTVDVIGSKVDLKSAAKSTISDDAVVPRCVNAVEDAEFGSRGGAGGGRGGGGAGGGQDQRNASAAAAGVILSAPVAPKDAKRPCCCRHHPQQHHHPQQQQQQHLSPGCQMSHPATTLVGRVPSNPRLINIPIPDDPRQWSRLDVRTWLDHVRRVYNIRDLDLDRFPMNGKALCIMSKDMFVYRVPQGGIPLYIDFQLRFRRALGFR